MALFQQPGAAIAQGAFNGNFQIGGSHKVMNAYEFLDTPGEFFFDKTSRTLYYYKASLRGHDDRDRCSRRTT